MSGKLPPSASVASALEGAKLHAPAAARNTEALCGLLRQHAPTSGQALELASGTGQHVIAFAAALPDVIWQPTEIGVTRLASINAYASGSGLSNINPARVLDATQPGWHRVHPDKSLIVLANLLHLITEQAANTLIAEALMALAPGGRAILYGPFKRAGTLTSPGDERFDAQLRGADPTIGYKDDSDVKGWVIQAGGSGIKTVEMPANNLAFIATKA
ncbi:hypothetical protein ROLI_031190 [Roseobacter fucihabitans]|uniref:Methyltransferase n=1 Tax=Roseobacter fucihabitans TaxID=1537242 RepID=A0ABZ2BWD1_9RHOB|nr:DUF938 domain-containing protein [Roseobacter litoralis]MBC6967176.1 hypothetical protein [Roseobacter litoralis]